jgi:RNA polymerase sigma-70 factor (ECF subfamily)
MTETDMAASRATAPVAEPRDESPSECPSNAECVALFKRVSQRDSSALERLYDLTVGHVYGLALRITGGSDVAEEVTESVFAQAWDEVGSFDPARDSPLKWLLLLCRERAIEALHKSRDCSVNSQASQLQDLVSGTEGSVSIQAALAKLRPRQRQLLNMAFFGGLTYEGLASKTGLAPGAVKSLMDTTMVLLREELNVAAGSSIER